MRGIAGLLAYYVVDTGGGDVATISILEDEAGAEEGTRRPGGRGRSGGATIAGRQPWVWRTARHGRPSGGR